MSEMYPLHRPFQISKYATAVCQSPVLDKSTDLCSHFSQRYQYFWFCYHFNNSQLPKCSKTRV